MGRNEKRKENKQKMKAGLAELKKTLEKPRKDRKSKEEELVMTVDSEDIDWTLNETEQIPDSERETLPIPANRPSTSSNSGRDRGRDRYLRTPEEVRRVPSRIRGPSPNARVTRSHTRSQREDHRRHQGENKRMIDSSDDHEVFITSCDDNFYSLELFLSGPIQSKSAEVIQETPKVLKSEMIYLSVPINSVLCACNFIKETPSDVCCGFEMKVELFCKKCVQRQVLHRKEQFAQRNSHQARLPQFSIYYCVLILIL